MFKFLIPNFKGTGRDLILEPSACEAEAVTIKPRSRFRSLRRRLRQKPTDKRQPGPARKQTLLSTAVVLVNDGSSGQHLCRALIDSGSQHHFDTEQFANKLAIKKERADYQVSGFHGSQTRTSNLVRASVKSRVADFSTELELLVTPRIVADQIDMLLGAGLFWNLPTLRETELGWVIGGVLKQAAD